MEDKRFTTRRNVMKLTTVPSFARIKGGFHQNNKDVYFIRCIGYNNYLCNEVESMDQLLTIGERNGMGKYHRFHTMQRLCDYAQIDFYTNTYNDWVTHQRKEIITKSIQKGMAISAVISQSLQEVELLFSENEVSLGESIQKNFMIKLLFWLDTIVGEWSSSWDPKSSYKLVYCGEVKQQEYLFFYLLSTLGFDVMLLNPAGELNVEPKLLELSDKIELEQKGSLSLSLFNRDNILGSIDNQMKEQSGSISRTKLPNTEIPNSETANSETINSEIQKTATPNAEVTQSIPIISSSSLKHPKREKNSDNNSTKENNIGAVQDSSMQIPSNTPSNAQIYSTQRTNGNVTSANETNGNATNRNVSNNVTRSNVSNSTTSSQCRELSFEELAQLASSVVMIAIHDKKGDVFATGSGIMINEKGYILTNNHVAKGGYGYYVRIEEDDNIYHTEEMIKYNDVLDLALIRIDRKCKPLPIYHSDKKLVRGQKVVAIGSPLGLFNSVSNGIISGFRKIDNVDMIQFTAPISHGSSGGAVLNMFGEVIGISTAGFDDGQNINLAVDYKWIQGFLRGFL